MKRTPIKNQLAQIRKTKGFAQKQVSKLLGHRSTVQLSRLERGLHVPNLKTALKLAQIYSIPIRVMLDEYFLTCQQEVRRQEIKFHGSASAAYDEPDVNFCSYEIKLGSSVVSRDDWGRIRSHTTRLVRKSAEKQGDI